MSEQVTETAVRLYTFGSWHKAEIADTGEPTETGKRLMDFLTGKPVGALSEREAQLLLEEFSQQEAYRNTLQTELLRVAGELQHEATASVKESAAPYRVTHSYDAGRSLGAYSAYSDAAQRVQNIINRLTVGAQERK